MGYSYVYEINDDVITLNIINYVEDGNVNFDLNNLIVIKSEDDKEGVQLRDVLQKNKDIKTINIDSDLTLNYNYFVLFLEYKIIDDEENETYEYKDLTVNVNCDIIINTLYNDCETTFNNLISINSICNYSTLNIENDFNNDNKHAFNYYSMDDEKVKLIIEDKENLYIITIPIIVENDNNKKYIESLEKKYPGKKYGKKLNIKCSQVEIKYSNRNIFEDGDYYETSGTVDKIQISGANRIDVSGLTRSKLVTKLLNNGGGDKYQDIKDNYYENYFEYIDDKSEYTDIKNNDNTYKIILDKLNKITSGQIGSENLKIKYEYEQKGQGDTFEISSASSNNSSLISIEAPIYTINPKNYNGNLLDIVGKNTNGQQNLTIGHELDDPEDEFNDIPNFSISGQVQNNLTVSNTGNFHSKNLTLKNLLDYKGSSVLIDSDVELNNDNIKKYEETLITEKKSNIDFKIINGNNHDYKLKFEELDAKDVEHQIQFKKLTISSDSLTVLSFPKPDELNLEVPDIETIEILGDSKISFENLDETKEQFIIRIPYGKKIEDVIVGELPKAKFKVEIAPQTTDEQLKEMENKIDELTDKINNLNSKLNKALAVLILTNDKLFN